MNKFGKLLENTGHRNAILLILISILTLLFVFCVVRLYKKVTKPNNPQKN